MNCPTCRALLPGHLSVCASRPHAQRPLEPRITFRTDTLGQAYVGIRIAGERQFISLSEAEDLARALPYVLADLKKCG